MNAVKNSALMDALASRWAGLASRERVLVGGALGLIAVAMLWWVGISPALAKLKQARQAAPALDAQLQIMRAQAQEASTLKAQRRLSYDESLRSLEASLKTLGAGAVLAVSDSRASITLKATSGDAIAQWLAQARANARLVPTELRLQKTAQAASASATPATPAAPAAVPASAPATHWDGTIVLTLPAR
jgi:general secretion pathway protein M